MKKAYFLFIILFSFATKSLAQVNIERCTEEDYINAFSASTVLCACEPSSTAELTPTDSMRIDSVLRHHYLAAEGYDSPGYELWRGKVIQRIITNEYVVEFSALIKGSGDPVGYRTAFLDPSFRPLGAIVGGHLKLHCCSHHLATLEVPLSEVPPILHLYRWESKNALPEEIGIYAPKNYVIQEFCYDLGSTLYVKGYELIDELYAGDTVYLKVTVK